jgi:hypothetical protein
VSKPMPKPKLIFALLLTFIVAIISFPAASATFFGIVGRTPEDPDWLQTVVIFVSFLASSIALLLSININSTRKFWLSKRILQTFSAITSIVSIGLHYGEMLAGKNNQPLVIAFTVITVLLIVLCSFFWSESLISISIIVMGTIFLYGLAFASATATFAYLSTDHFLVGIIWVIFSLGVIASTTVLLTFIAKEIISYQSK